VVKKSSNYEEPPGAPQAVAEDGAHQACYCRCRRIPNRSQPFTSLDRILDGKGEFTENILYQIVSLLQGQVEIKPAAHQYSDDLTHLSGLKHIDYRKQFLYQPVMDTRDDCCER
jgi:hypothetical protein